MTKLTFAVADVKRVVEHALASPKHRPRTVGYKGGRAITKPGVPSVILVHDEGVYLMSNGDPRDIIEGTRSFVAYAKGCAPSDPDSWERSCRLVGGEDFAETLPFAESIKAAIDGGALLIRLLVSERSIELVT